MNAYDTSYKDIQSVLDQTSTPAGWYLLISTQRNVPKDIKDKYSDIPSLFSLYCYSLNVSRK